MVYLPLGFSLFLFCWKNLAKEENIQNLACVFWFLSELWHFSFLTLLPVRLEIVVCPFFEPQYIFATKVTRTSVTWEAKLCPNTLHLWFSAFGLFLLQCATPTRKWTKWHFGPILTAAFLDNSFKIWNYFCCNSWRGALAFLLAGKINKNFIQFDTATA